MKPFTFYVALAGFILGAVLVFLVFRSKNKVGGNQTTKFLRLLVSATSQESSKRFVVVVLILLFFVINIVSIVIMWLLMFKLLPVPDNTVALFFKFWGNVVDYDAFIISFGIGATVVSNSVSFLSTILSRRADAAVAAATNKVAENVTINREVKQQTIQADVVKQEAAPQADTGVDDKPQTGSGTVNIQEK